MDRILRRVWGYRRNHSCVTRIALRGTLAGMPDGLVCLLVGSVLGVLTAVIDVFVLPPRR
jgi:hypothetical protein